MIASNVALDKGMVIHPDLINLHGYSIGAGTRIGTFVEVQENAVIGRTCKISSHSFICDGAKLEDGSLLATAVCS